MKADRQSRVVEKELGRLARQLRANHPELLGIGLGYRRRRGKITRGDGLVVKLLVNKKPKRLPSGRRGKLVGAKLFPKQIEIKTFALGQPVTVSLSTDVEEVQRLSFSAGPPQVGGMTVALLASWIDAGGAQQRGWITAGHGFIHGGQPPGTPVQVQLPDGSAASGTLVAGSNYLIDGIDAALVAVAQADTNKLADVGSSTFSPASADQLVHLLGTSDRDRLSVQGQTWAISPPVDLSAVAYLSEWTVETPQGRFTMTSVVEAYSPEACFQPGTSGSLWVTSDQEPNLSLALQSQSNKPRYSTGFGSHLVAALAWLGQQPGINNLKWGCLRSELP